MSNPVILFPYSPSQFEELISKVVRREITAAAQVEKGGLLDAGGAAKFLGISKEVVYRLTRQKKIPHRMIGTVARYSPDELRQWDGYDQAAEDNNEVQKQMEAISKKVLKKAVGQRHQ